MDATIGFGCCGYILHVCVCVCVCVLGYMCLCMCGVYVCEYEYVLTCVHAYLEACGHAYQGFPVRKVYLHYISCLRYTILVGNPRYARMHG